MEFYCRVVDEELESLWVRIRGQAYRGDAVVDVCYRSNHKEEAD